MITHNVNLPNCKTNKYCMPTGFTKNVLWNTRTGIKTARNYNGMQENLLHRMTTHPHTINWNCWSNISWLPLHHTVGPTESQTIHSQKFNNYYYFHFLFNQLSFPHSLQLWLGQLGPQKGALGITQMFFMRWMPFPMQN